MYDLKKQLSDNMYLLDTAQTSVEATSKLHNVHPPTSGFEPFSTFEHVGLRASNENIASQPYSLSPMFNPFSSQSLWKAVNDHVENARSETALKAEADVFDSSLEMSYSTETLWKTLSSNVGIIPSDVVPKTVEEPEPDSGKTSEICVNVEQNSTVTSSEQASPTSSESSSQSGGSKKKSRTVFTNSQLRELQSTFARKKYLTTEERMKMAADIGLSHTKIKTWFQNRRMKWKRENHCTIPGLIPSNVPDCLPTTTALEKSLIQIPNTPLPPYPSSTSQLQMPSTLPLLTPSCMASLPQPNHTYSNGFYMNNSLLGQSSAQNLFNNDLRFSPVPPMSLSDAPTYDTSISYSSSKYPYQTTLTNKDSLLMVAPPTQSFFTL